MGRGGRGGLVGGRGTGDWRVGDALLEAAPGACTSLPKTRLSRWVWHKRGGGGAKPTRAWYNHKGEVKPQGRGNTTREG